MRNYLPLPIFLIFFFISFTLPAQTPFTKGVNLTGWFQVANARQIHFTKYTKQEFSKISSGVFICKNTASGTTTVLKLILKN